jgi:hypothetical protein
MRLTNDLMNWYHIFIFYAIYDSKQPSLYLTKGRDLIPLPLKVPLMLKWFPLKQTQFEFQVLQGKKGLFTSYHFTYD